MERRLRLCGPKLAFRGAIANPLRPPPAPGRAPAPCGGADSRAGAGQGDLRGWEVVAQNGSGSWQRFFAVGIFCPQPCLTLPTRAANSAPPPAATRRRGKSRRLGPALFAEMVCCCSSVVERILGKAEVGSSILPSSTISRQTRPAVIAGPTLRRGFHACKSAHSGWRRNCAAT